VGLIFKLEDVDREGFMVSEFRELEGVGLGGWGETVEMSSGSFTGLEVVSGVSDGVRSRRMWLGEVPFMFVSDGGGEVAREDRAV
jgi:hypothetical protein